MKVTWDDSDCNKWCMTVMRQLYNIKYNTQVVYVILGYDIILSVPPRVLAVICVYMYVGAYLLLCSIL